MIQLKTAIITAAGTLLLGTIASLLVCEYIADKDNPPSISAQVTGALPGPPKESYYSVEKIVGSTAMAAIQTRHTLYSIWTHEGRTFTEDELDAAALAQLKSDLPFISYPTDADRAAARERVRKREEQDHAK